MRPAIPEDTGVLAVPAPTFAIDPDVRQDVVSALWLIAVTVVPGILLIPFLI